MALLRAVRDCGTLRAVSLVNLGLGDHFCRSLARVLPRLAALRLLDVDPNPNPNPNPNRNRNPNPKPKRNRNPNPSPNLLSSS